MNGPAVVATGAHRAYDIIEALVDAGTFECWDSPPTWAPDDGEYRETLARARQRSGVDESIVTGLAHLAGQAVVLIIGEFHFLAGSIGSAAAERILKALERATAARLPVLASTASGGTRMQEGTPAFVRMLDISAAIARHRSAELAYLVYLRHPTTGGVMASWGALGQVTLAEPGALLGFLGPRVSELLTEAPMPQGVQTAENLVTRGFVDAIVPLDGLRATIAPVLTALTPPPEPASTNRLVMDTAPILAVDDAWATVTATRQPDRISLTELLRNGIEMLTPLAGTGQGRAALQVRLARVEGIPCVLAAQDRGAATSLRPADLRAARRGMELAQEWGIPLVTVVDTAGAELSAEAENEGLAFEIARCIYDLGSLTVPTVSVLLGQGTGGGALALLGARRIIATQHSWLSPLPPEGASAIVYRDTRHAAELARRQQIGAADLFAAGTVHHIVPEAAGQDVDSLATAVNRTIAVILEEQMEMADQC